MIIEVQHCVDCHLHNWCSRHNEAKYHEFYHKLEGKVKSAFKNAEIIKNHPPHHLQQRNASTTVGLQVHHYFDEDKNEEVVFPRHGAFQIKVNGILIFSKLQSNLWPNLQRIGNLLQQIAFELQAGKDIHRFSLQYRMENNKQELMETYKKLIKFKINKRPLSSQFNATAYFTRGTIEQSPETKQEKFKRKNVASLKKGTNDAHRKSDVIKKPLINFRNSKVQVVNMYSEFKETKNEQPCTFPEVGKIVKNQHVSSYSKKKIQFKNDNFHPIRSQPFEIIGNNNASGLKLEKKPSRKLIIKNNEKRNENSPHFASKYGQNLQDQMDDSDKVIINHNPTLFPQIPTKKSLKSLKSVMSIGEKLQSKGSNDIKIEDYTQKQIQKFKHKSEHKTEVFEQSAQFQPINKTEKLVNQQYNHKQQIVKITQNEQKNGNEAEQNQKQQCLVKEKQVPFEDNKQTVQQQSQKPNINRNTEYSNQKYEQELYDDFQIEQNREQARPQTSSSRRMFRQELVEKEQQILQQQSVIEVNFKRKSNATVDKMSSQYEEDFAVQVEDVPIVINQAQKMEKSHKIMEQQVFQLTAKEQIDEMAKIRQENLVFQQKLQVPEMSLQISNQNYQQLPQQVEVQQIEQTKEYKIEQQQLNQDNSEAQLKAQIMNQEAIENNTILDIISKENQLPKIHSQKQLQYVENEFPPQKNQQKSYQNYEQQLILPQYQQLEDQIQRFLLEIMMYIEQSIEEQQKFQVAQQQKEQQQVHQSNQKIKQIESASEQNLENQIQIKKVEQKESFQEQIQQDPKTDSLKVVQQKQETIHNQDQQQIQQKDQTLVAEAQNDLLAIKPQISQAQQQGMPQVQQQLARKGSLPSIRLIPNKEVNAETQRSLPNATQSSIGLSSQIHSELNNVYDQIQARFDAGNSLEQEDTE